LISVIAYLAFTTALLTDDYIDLALCFYFYRVQVNIAIVEENFPSVEENITQESANKLNTKH